MIHSEVPVKYAYDDNLYVNGQFSKQTPLLKLEKTNNLNGHFVMNIGLGLKNKALRFEKASVIALCLATAATIATLIALACFPALSLAFGLTLVGTMVLFECLKMVAKHYAKKCMNLHAVISSSRNALVDQSEKRNITRPLLIKKPDAPDVVIATAPRPRFNSF